MVIGIKEIKIRFQRVSGTGFAVEYYAKHKDKLPPYKNQMIRLEDRYNFEKRVLSTKEGMVLVNFWAWWSEECRTMYAIMRDIAAFIDKQDAIVYIDWERQKRLAQELEIFGVPY